MPMELLLGWHAEGGKRMESGMAKGEVRPFT
jgi:hypothetical protein